MSDLIDRQAAIEALERDMASLDHIIKDMSANDVRLDAYVSQRNQVNYDIYTINNLPPVQPEIIRCKDCKHYHADVFGSELKLPSIYDHIIVAHHGCKRWSQDENDMKCVKPDGYCFLAERREE